MRQIVEIDAWDPSAEDLKIITGFVYEYWEDKELFETSDLIPTSDLFDIRCDGALSQMAFKMAMLSGARQFFDPDLAQAFSTGNPFRIDTCGKPSARLPAPFQKQTDPFLIKVTDAQDITCAFVMAVQNPFAIEKWNQWIDHVVGDQSEWKPVFLGETGVPHIKHWLKIYLEWSDEYKFQFYKFDDGGKTIGTGRKIGEPEKKTAIDYLNALVKGELRREHTGSQRNFFDEATQGVTNAVKDRIRSFCFQPQLRIGEC